MGANFGRDVKRAGLAILTSGTSEIRTGGGAYGDETVADTLFPKAINDWALEGRATDRGMKDVEASLAKAKLDEEKPGPMDLTDETLSTARKSAKLKAMQGVNRQSTFRPASTGGSTMPKLGMKKLYGL